MSFYRDIITSHLLASTSDARIGGVGKTVEIDESMFGSCSLQPTFPMRCMYVAIYCHTGLFRETEIQQGPMLWPPEGLGSWRHL